MAINTLFMGPVMNRLTKLPTMLLAVFTVTAISSVQDFLDLQRRPDIELAVHYGLVQAGQFCPVVPVDQIHGGRAGQKRYNQSENDT